MMLAYGYCRYSSNLQDEKSIEQQKRELQDFAKRNDIKRTQTSRWKKNR